MIAVPSRIKGLIFDLDGTVANTMQNHYIAWKTAVEPYGIKFTGEVFVQLTGMPKAATIEKLNEMYGTAMDPTLVGKVKAETYKALVNQTEEIEIVADVVRRYHGKLPMAIGTGSTQIGAHRTLRILNMTQYFDAIVTADDVVNFKPAPDTFLKCAEAIGVAPEDCLVFEDGILGMQAARAIGMEVVDVNDYFEMIFED